MWTWHDGPGGWGVLWMFLMMSVLWIPLIVLLLWGIRGCSASNDRRELLAPPSDSTHDPREIARRTYARGEIDRERFLQLIEDLDRTESSSPRP